MEKNNLSNCNMKTIEIDGVPYSLDLDKCVRDGYLKKDLVFQVGGVYTHPRQNTNDFLLVQAIYVGHTEQNSKRAYALLGLSGGFSSNSGSFFDKLHTKDEILTYLSDNGMSLSYKAEKAIK